MFPSQPKAERLALTATYALLGAGVAAMGALAGLQHLLARKPKRHLAEMSNAEIDATMPEPRDAHVRRGDDEIHVFPDAMAERIDQITANHVQRMARLARMSPSKPGRDAYDKAYREWGQLDV